MAWAEAVVCAPVDGDHLILPSIGYLGTAIDGDDTRIHFNFWGMGRIAGKAAFRGGQQPIAGADFFFGGRNQHGSRHVF